MSFEGANDAGGGFLGTSREQRPEGTSLTNFYRKQFVDLLITGRCYTLVISTNCGNAGERAERGKH